MININVTLYLTDLNMGCSIFRSDKPDLPEEIIFVKSECLIGFKFVVASEYDKLMTRYASGDYITDQNLRIILKILGISYIKFFKNFYCEDNKAYNSKRLVTLGVLLGKDDDNIKRNLLFHNYDRKDLGKISISDIKEICDDIKIISIEYMAGLCKESFKFASDDFDRYKNRLHKGSFFLENHICTLFSSISNSNIKKHEFIICLNDISLQKLTSAAGFRELSYYFSKEIDNISRRMS